MSETEPLNRVGSIHSHVTCVTARFLVMHVQVRHRAARLTPPGASPMVAANALIQIRRPDSDRGPWTSQ